MFEVETKHIERIAQIKSGDGGDRIPEHVAIIMDGNGRWAHARGLERRDGHEAGVEAVKRVVRVASELGVKYLTLYTFSRENWNRPKAEVEALMSLLSRSTLQETDELVRNNVRLVVTGRFEDIPFIRRKVLQEAIRRTSGNDGLTLNLALSYGGRVEILDAVKAFCKDVVKGEVELDKLDEKQFSDYLYTVGMPDPDLLIRTSGELRLSNFLLWQTSYTELYMTDILWPDFGEDEFLDGVEDYLVRERRFGKVRS